jgi:hypothetical protein
MKTKLAITGLLATALMTAPMAPAMAHDKHTARPVQHRPAARHVEPRHGNGDNVAAGLFIGLAALTTAAIVASAAQPAPPRPVYYAAPAPVYRYARPHRKVVYRHAPVYRYAGRPTYVLVR